MKQVKKTFAILMALTMLLGLIPATSVAAEGYIGAVSLNVVAPVAGKTPSYQATQLSEHIFLDTEDETYGVCQSNGIIWFTQSGNAMLPTETFKVGKRYTVRVMLGAEAPYGFTDAPIVTVNGAEGYISYRYSASWMDIEYEFPAVQGYTITFNAGNGSGTMAPVTDIAGDYQLPECTFTPPYSTQEFKCWRLSTEPNDWYPGNTINVKQNITATAIWRNKSTKQQICEVAATSDDFDAMPKLYGKISIPDFAITQGAPAYITNSTGNFRWEKKVDGVWEYQPEGRFTAGEWRVQAQVRVDGEEAADYELGAPFSLTVNGTPWTDESDGIPQVHNDYSMIFVYSPIYVIEDDPNIKPPIEISKASFSLSGYYKDASVSEARVVTSDKVTVTGVLFGVAIDSNNDGEYDNFQMAQGKFDSKTQYIVLFEFVAKDGYDISKLDSHSITLNGSSASVYNSYSDFDESYECVFMLEKAETNSMAGPKLIKQNGVWRYYVNGVKSNATTLAKINGKWFFIQKGVWNSKTTSLYKLNGKWFFIKDGKWSSSLKGLVKYSGKYFYVTGGKWNSSVNTLYKKSGKYFAVKNGKWHKSKTIIKYKGKRFYCNKGYAQLSFSGKVKIGSKTYKVKKGVVK